MTPEGKNDKDDIKPFVVSYPRKALHGTIWVIPGLNPLTGKDNGAIMRAKWREST